MYQVLARKYRPRNFNELVGQNHVSRALTSALERGRLHHAYLFTGTRGVGKTTIARILAKCLNCETGITSTPCEVCATCTAVNEGRFIDLIEIDAASRTKVEDTRELLDNVPYAPTQGRFKVYLIDEVHMLSTHSFNALLKTLEEPPEHVKFLFATTDPQKLPITVISRCLQFTLRPLAVDEITEHLGNILSKESIQSDQDAIWQIAESAQGSLRDALSLTDQAIAYGQGVIQHQDVKDMLGLIDRTIIYDLILAIHQNQKAHVSQLLLQFRQQALDVSLVLDQLISTLHELALLQYLPDLSLKYSAEINQKIMQLSGLISAQDLQLYYQIAYKGRADLQLAVTQEQGFEMTVLRLLAFRPLQPSEIPVMQETASQQATTHTTRLQPPVQTQLQSESIETQSLEAEPVFDDFSLDDGTDEEIDVASASGPSSDDFLDEEEPTSITAPESVQPVVIQTTIEEVQSSDQIVFDPNDDKGLFGFDEIESTPEAPATSNSSDDFLLEEFIPADAVIPAEPVQETMSADEEFSLAAPEIELSQETTDQPALENTASVQPVAQTALLEDISQDVNTQNLMPQDILKIPEQTLEGEWSVEKWEYWFRNSQLSPAVQELAQYGVMTGQMNGESVFHIPEQYQQLLTQLQHNLEAALQQQWPQTNFQVKFENVDQLTPYTMQHQRKARAFKRAEELLHAEPAVRDLLQQFDGELQNIQLK
ncbi:DNA polymerase III subunit gamma/tau [Acinetobacter lwoffii]|jgi:DNA polymerase III subunit gamma/tau|uniref:DNA polymerase III subunit gamma/tau n=1 Tax=Acinetobacter lwoffii TaxID=28090 RepID=A0A4Q4E0P1_ACILW|nr:MULTISPECIES: DNA polymerase III subunit gamma/tau [Acinetobacter]EEY90706.1 DNA polymerase III, subunit gamma and tau [Acinetobacter lwoffii SH145]ENU62402.1 DNA polymerase III, subunit gamma and tau [Acinetobacter lwoffii NIPH 715]ENW29848.1 DNA polymerase III, subunit gamma and tau [Acinetobacter lwoffii ATCC 9957 = CIP 70.31]ENX30904.1 DNA polymerase III, subunit gamma and tau [Acinetobacter sp. CIP 64.7]MCU4419956.1 DNA polymerase III subunit gamma/tau [Acinetobacter lwoffii]